MATSPRAQVILDGDVGPLRQKLREATQGINAFGRDSAGALNDTLGPAQALQAKFVGIAAAITSGAFATFVKSSINIQDEMSKSAQKAGVTTEQFSGMAYAARLADVEVDTLTKTYSKLNALLADGQQGQKEAVETFRRLKIDPKNLQDADALLLALAERFEGMPDGVAKSSLAIDVFGEKLGPGLIPFLNQGRAGIQDLREEAARLGVVIDTQTGKAAEEFNDTITRLQTGIQGAGMQLATALLPVLQAVTSEFVAVNNEGGKVNALAAALRVTFEALAVIGANVAYVFQTIGRDIGGVVAGYQALVTFDFAGFRAISDALKADGIRSRAELDELEQRILRLGKYSPVQGAGGGRGSILPPFAVPGFKPDGKPPANVPKAAAAEKSLMASYELHLAEEKRVAAILDAGREYAKERELAYWRSVLNTTTLSANDRVAILRKAAALEVEIAGKAARDRVAYDAEALAQSEALALGKVDGQRAAAKAALDLGQITNLQFLQLDGQYEAQRYQIQRAALEQRLALLANDPTTSEAEKLRLMGRLLALDQQYEQRKLDIQTGLTKAGGPDAFSELGTAWSQTLGSMASGTQTWAGTMQGLFGGVRDVFMRTMVSEPLGLYIATQARMLAAKLGFITQETALQTAGSGATVAVKGAETLAVGGLNATQAGTGAFAALAAIPVIGPALAAAAGPAMFATVMAMVTRGMAGNKSAAGGYDIPSGINPMTQLHEEEMVLPQHLANAVRSMAGQASGGAPAGGGGDVHVQISGGSVGDWVMVHRNELKAGVARALRDSHGRWNK